MRHASFFSGVGGLDLGFHNAGIETVSLSEIDPYACQVLGERFVGVPNLGNILEVKADDIPEADIWSGGFPCQDLSVAGKRAGFAGKRSSLAFTFLDAVEQRKPRWLLLENVPGLFSSNGGADFGRLISEMVTLGYGISWRVLDARWFGVAQRRKRVFIVAALNDAFTGAGAERAAEVLFECQGGCGHIEAGNTQGQAVAASPTSSAGISSTVTSKWAKGSGGPAGDEIQNLTLSAPPDSYGMRAADGLGGWVDNSERVDTFGAETHRALQARDWKAGVANQDIGQEGFLVGSLTGGGNDSPQSERIFDERGVAPTLDTGRAIPTVFRKSARVTGPDTAETWVDDGLANTLNNFDVGDIRTTHAVLGGEPMDEDDLPLGLDSNRYRCCGNGVVAPVAEWIGRRILAVDAKHYKGGA
jgi:DNA-cytosine methyltransferase